MPWNPDTYNQFKDIRYQPFFDLMKLISDESIREAIDLGCGTGEQTSLLAQRFPATFFTGIDASPEMMKESKQFSLPNLQFRQSTTEAFIATDSTWDLIFSNAALQWSDDHGTLFPALISKLKSGGQFAVQMPFQKENLLNTILLDIVTRAPFNKWLNGFRRESPLLTIDEYANILFHAGLSDLNISLRVYPIIAKDATKLYNFIAGSAIIPYMERLTEEQQELLKQKMLEHIKDAFLSFPAIYSFKRLLLYGVKK